MITNKEIFTLNYFESHVFNYTCYMQLKTQPSKGTKENLLCS